MNRLFKLFSGIIAARVAMGAPRNGFERILAQYRPSFRVRLSRNAKPHCGAAESARRVRQHKKAFHNYSPAVGWNAGAYTNKGGQWDVARCESWKLEPKPHAAKFPAGTSQPKPRRRGFYWANPRFEDNRLILDEYSQIEEQVWGHTGSKVIMFVNTERNVGKTQEVKRIVSGIKWRHLA